MLEFFNVYSGAFGLFLTILGWIIVPISAYFIPKYLSKNAKILKASKSIVETIKPIILDNEEITIAYVQLLINSTCRQFKISNVSLNTEFVLEDLLLDISKANYVGISQKVTLINHITKLLKNNNNVSINELIKDFDKNLIKEKKTENIASFISVTTLSLSLLVTIFLTNFLEEYSASNYLKELDIFFINLAKENALLFPALIGIIIGFLLVIPALAKIVVKSIRDNLKKFK